MNLYEWDALWVFTLYQASANISPHGLHLAGRHIDVSRKTVVTLGELDVRLHYSSYSYEGCAFAPFGMIPGFGNPCVEYSHIGHLQTVFCIVDLSIKATQRHTPTMMFVTEGGGLA